MFSESSSICTCASELEQVGVPLRLQETRFTDSVRVCVKTMAASQSSILCLGQTVFWDEPLKAIVLAACQQAGVAIPFLMAVHDTDYFGKLPGRRSGSGYGLYWHDDALNKELWAAVAETASLFGAEVPVEKTELRQAGAALRMLERLHPEGKAAFYRETTAAYGWRGIASHSRHPKVACDASVGEVRDVLREMIEWAFSETASLLIDDEARANLRRWQTALIAGICDREDVNGGTITELYKELLRTICTMLLGSSACGFTTSASTELFRFNPRTCHLPRFDVLKYFLDPATRQDAIACYNKVVDGTSIYALDRFGEDAIPFDLVVPGRGRGAICIQGRRVVCELADGTVEVEGGSDLVTCQQLAELVAREFGPTACVVGKAIVLPLMTGREWVLLLHETASHYMPLTHRLHLLLQDRGIELRLHPLLRFKLELWDALDEVPTHFALPAHLRRFFGSECVTGSQFAATWRAAVGRAKQLIVQVSAARAPALLLQVANRYGVVTTDLEDRLTEATARRRSSGAQIHSLRKKSQELWCRVKRARKQADHAQVAPPKEVYAWEEQRQKIVTEILQIANSSTHQTAQADHQRMIEEIETLRLQMLTDAFRTLALEQANHRPPWWWPMATDFSGRWLRRLAETAELQFEPFGERAEDPNRNS